MVVSGMAISAVQPSSVIRAATSQTPSRVAFAFLRDLLLELRAERRRHEHVAVARIIEGVDDQLEVVLVEEPVGVAAHLGGHDAGGLRVERMDRDQQRAAVIEDADLGPLCGRGAFARLLLRELGEERRPLPDLVVEHPVDTWRLVDVHGRHRVPLAMRLDSRMLVCLREDGAGQRQRCGQSRGRNDPCSRHRGIHDSPGDAGAPDVNRQKFPDGNEADAAASTHPRSASYGCAPRRRSTSMPSRNSSVTGT
jgi:hypothetical protein